MYHVLYAKIGSTSFIPSFSSLVFSLVFSSSAVFTSFYFYQIEKPEDEIAFLERQFLESEDLRICKEKRKTEKKLWHYIKVM